MAKGKESKGGSGTKVVFGKAGKKNGKQKKSFGPSEEKPKPYRGQGR